MTKALLLIRNSWVSFEPQCQADTDRRIAGNMVRIVYPLENREIIFYSSSTSLQDTKQRENIPLKVF